MYIAELLEILSAFFVLSGILVALLIALNIRRHRQPMKIMEAVWPLTGLWAHWFAWASYRIFGKSTSGPMSDSMSKSRMASGTGSGSMAMHRSSRPAWRSVALSTLHCGAGCTLADILGEWFTFFVPLSIGGSFLAGQWVLDFVLALLLGVYFHYSAIRGMERISPAKGFSKALKADFFSLTAWQIGMYTWMAFVIFLIRDGSSFPKTTWTFWFMMQIAMGIGFFFSFPVNRLLIRTGIKHEM